LPRLDVDVERLTQIGGQPPSLLNPPPGCRFSPRCDYSFGRCRSELPSPQPSSSDPAHLDACFLTDQQKLDEAQRVVIRHGEGGAA
jgi:oligopeptide/dipeptide ABC transporter ATP-binding protein